MSNDKQDMHYVKSLKNKKLVISINFISQIAFHLGVHNSGVFSNELYDMTWTFNRIKNPYFFQILHKNGLYCLFSI